MGNTATNVTTGKPKITGALFRAPRTATVPTDATTSLGSSFVCLGYIAEDGVENGNDLETSTIKAWGGVTVYRSVNGLDDTFKFTLLESENVDVLKAVYNEDNVSVDATTGEVAVHVKADDPEESIWVFELALRGGKAKRMVVPDGAITSREPIKYNDSDAVAYGVTVTAYPDAAGETHQEYIV